ncbi:hypothetical protein TS85_02185 [Sphingomonas hengshuiensis]|uniref:Uncharacterized protein n=1 Tax=Sphingomonas hengshuiensis TaxID=1609977 RepID=A0A7U5BEQ8_9SPHN|nr:hypothetical protein TS85_02185 [Sphingomonas hengshuiensis]
MASLSSRDRHEPVTVFALLNFAMYDCTRRVAPDLVAGHRPEYFEPAICKQLRLNWTPYVRSLVFHWDQYADQSDEAFFPMVLVQSHLINFEARRVIGKTGQR